MGSKLLDLKRQAQLNKVLELLVTGEASSISQACETAGVSRSLVYRALAAGTLDEAIARLKHTAVQQIATLLASELPEIIEKRIAEAKGDEGSLRDKDSITRTLMIAWEKLAGGVADEVPSSEDAQEWLKRFRATTQPVQIITSKVDIRPPDFSPMLGKVVFAEEVVDGEVEEVES